MKKRTTEILTRLFSVTTLLFTTVLNVSAQSPSSGSYDRGITLFNTKDYTAAIEEFKKAEAEDPENQPAYLWHGLAVMASGADLTHVNDAAALWNSKTLGDNQNLAMSQYFLGLGYWRVDYTSVAKTWFGLTSSFKNTTAYRLAQKALTSMANNDKVPPIESWASVAGLPITKTANIQAANTNNRNTATATPATTNKTAGSTTQVPANQQTYAVTEDADGTLSADRPILACPVAQKHVKNGTAPDLKVLEKVFRCQSGEKAAAKGMDGAFIINVESMQVGKPRLMDYLADKGDGTPGKTLVYPIKVTWTEKTFYRTRTAVVERKIAIVNFNVNSFGEWQYGSAKNISDGTYKSIPRN
jgi:hypothetical protein